jgi:ketosteroid isomerase-like protein
VTSTSLDHESSLFAFADRFFGAVAAGDIDTVRACYSPDVRVWHNFDMVEQNREENLQLLAHVSATWKNFRFEDVRRRIVEGGFIQQHTMRGEGPDDKPFECPSLLIVQVEGDTIVRIEEYFDPHQTPMAG